MNVVGKVGSFITQGVYSVATPFHPFGGAVDIIVVQQQDGSFRSTPWYVQFGKFQGVLKGAEKVVRINVNGIEANFHMYLDNSGEAYFIREADSSQDEKNRVPKEEVSLEHSFSVDNSDCSINKENVEQYRLQSSMSDPGVLRDDYRLERCDSDACRFYDFQDDQSYEGSVDLSSEFGSSRYDNIEGVENFVEAQGSDSEMVLVSVDGHILTAPISSSEQDTENVQLGTPQFHLGPGESNGFGEGNREVRFSENAWENECLNDLDSSPSKRDLFGSFDEDNNTYSHERQSGIYELEEQGIQEKGSDDIHQLDVCQSGQECHDQKEDERHTSHRADMFDCCEVSGKSEDQGEARQYMHELEIGDKKGKHTDGHEGEDKERGMQLYQDHETGCTENQDRICVPNDIEEVSPSSDKEDKFRSCLDLTIAAGDETLESEDPQLEVQEAAKNLVKEPSHNVEVSDKTEVEHASDVSHLSVEHVIDINAEGAAEAKKNSDSSTSTAAQEAVRVRNITEAIHSEDTSVGKDSVFENELVSLKPLAETAKSKSEGDLSKTELNRIELLDPQTQSLSARRPFDSTFEISLCRDLLHRGMGLSAADEVFSAHRISVEEFRTSVVSLIKNENLVIRYREKYLPWDKAAPLVLGKAAFGLDLSIEPNDAIPVEQEMTPKVGDDSGSDSGRRWRLWPIPFRRVKTVRHSNSNSSEEVFRDSVSVLQNHSIEQTPTAQSGTPRSETSSNSLHKKIVRTIIPTNEQISSLNLKEGQNDVTFSFSTRVLGLQQVEAHIYLWKWNARIVISDVDGTITKSDVLGQFMPLVGKDWSQSGVARLFSAIKENGYQLLFLSARAIVQAYLTKSFLFNLKQDGKTLPTGPVVISPNGLFPSLFREVIRRAPHEFKIACLEDIKALFPPDYNPFYAGFGNRDTDELTYRKIGIPKGKIFIINPKGEVAISHQIDVKSYTSLHTLVNDMFPPTSMVEQEDYNSWNYWKIPLPDIDI